MEGAMTIDRWIDDKHEKLEIEAELDVSHTLLPFIFLVYAKVHSHLNLLVLCFKSSL